MKWLVDTHLEPYSDQFIALPRIGAFDEAMLPHVYDAMAGAGSLIFAVASECRRLTGLDPETEQAVEAHAEFVAHRLVP